VSPARALRATLPVRWRIMPEGRQNRPVPGSNYPAVGAVVIGLSVGIAISAATGEAMFMFAGLVAGAAAAVWLGRGGRRGDRDQG
jgi:hypothetical protein